MNSKTTDRFRASPQLMKAEIFLGDSCYFNGKPEPAGVLARIKKTAPC